MTSGAKKYNYYAYLQADAFRHRLQIRPGVSEKGQTAGTSFGVIISIHPVGREFTGVPAVTAFCEYREFSAENGAGSEPTFINDQPFILTYKEDGTKISADFEQWLDETPAPAEWQDQL